MLFASILAISAFLGIATFLFDFSVVSIAIACMVVPVIAFAFASYSLLIPPWHQAYPDGEIKTKISGRAKEWYGPHITNPKHDHDIDYEDIELKCDDDGDAYLISAWHVLPSSSSEAKTQETSTTTVPSEVCIICVHGGGRDRRAFLRHLPAFYRQGYGAILFDCRDHGTSDIRGRGLSYTARESVDCANVARLARSQLGYNKVILVGTSQGATASIIAASLDDQLVEAVIAENPFTDRQVLMEQIIFKALGKSPGLTFAKKLYTRAIVKTALIRARIDPSKHHNARDVIHRMTTPLSILHGDNDTLTPLEMGQELYDRAIASKDREIWIVNGGEHTGLWNLEKEEWERRVLNFISKHIN